MKEIDKTAVVSPSAVLEDGVFIGPYCVIGPNVKICAGARLMSHIVIDGYTTIGASCSIFPFASIGTQTQDLKYKGGKTFVEIGEGTTLREYVTVNSGTEEGEVTKVGKKCHVMAYCHVAHGCKVGNEVIMANCATLAGYVTVEDMAVIGGLAAVHQFVRIGKMCMIGGCSKITQDCPPFMLVDGNPVSVHGPNSVGLKRRGINENAQRLIKEAYKILYRQNLSVSQAVEKIKAELSLCEEIEYLLKFIELSQRGIIK